MADKRAPKKLLELRKTVPKSKLALRSDDNVPVLKRGSRMEAPPAISSLYVRKLWNITTANLIDLEIVAVQDLPQLELAFLMLEEFHNDRASLDAIRSTHEGAVTDPGALAEITKLQRAMTNLASQFTQIMGRYGISPSDRAKMQWEHLDAEQKNANPIEMLLEE